MDFHLLVKPPENLNFSIPKVATLVASSVEPNLPSGMDSKTSLGFGAVSPIAGGQSRAGDEEFSCHALGAMI
jgi:hypothetical protein